MKTMHDASSDTYQGKNYIVITEIAKDGFEPEERFCVGVGLCSSFENTNELKVLTYHDAFNSKNRIK